MRAHTSERLELLRLGSIAPLSRPLPPLPSQYLEIAAANFVALQVMYFVFCVSWFNCCFCFLQSYHLPYFADKPLALAEQEVGVETRPQVLERAMHVLDQVPTLDTHKIGVIYVGEGQTSGKHFG